MKTFVNMLPESFRKRNLLRLRLAQWAPVWVLVFAGAASACWSEYSKFTAASDVALAKERQYAVVDRLNVELVSIRERLKGLQEHEAIAAELVNNQPLLSLVGIVSRSARQCGGKLRIEKFSLGRGTPSASRTNQQQTPAAAPRRQLVLQGKSVDNLAIPKFVALLRQAGIFEQVELKSAKEGRSEGDRAHSYLVECSL